MDWLVRRAALQLGAKVGSSSGCTVVQQRRSDLATDTLVRRCRGVGLQWYEVGELERFADGTPG